MEQLADQAIEAGLYHQQEFIEEVVVQMSELTMTAATKWFNKTFDRNMLNQMERYGIIENVNAFRNDKLIDFHKSISSMIDIKQSE